MSLSIESGPKFPPGWKGNPERIKGTVFAAGWAQGSKYVKGYTGAPIPAFFEKDNNPKMQMVLYLVGQSGKAVRIFMYKSKKIGSPWVAWTDAVKRLNSAEFDVLLGRTFDIICKTTYEPDGVTVSFREWTVTEVPGEDYRPNMEAEWQQLPQGILPTFYYPGWSPEERMAAAAAAPVAAPAAVTMAPPVTVAPVQTVPVAAVSAPVAQAAVAAQVAPVQPSIYDEDIPF